MFYLHEPINYDEIANETTIHINLAGKEFHCTCPSCGVEVVASAYDLCENLVLTANNETAYCPACSKKMLAESEADDADVLIGDLVDRTRDEDGAQRFVYLKDKGIIVDIDHCTDFGLITAADEQLARELAEAEKEITKVKRRLVELETPKAKPPYRVTWNDQEGNERERYFDDYDDAILEADDLKKAYVGVMVIDQDGDRLY